MTDIIMVTYQRESIVVRSILELHNMTEDYRLIVVDNGSNDRLRGFLLQAQNEGLIDTLVLLNENKGLEVARNIGQKFVETSRCVHIDSDILVSKDWLVKLNELMDKNPDYAAIACRPQMLIGVGPIFRDTSELVENNVVGGVARLMNVQALNEVGGWDNQFLKEGRGQEEWNICGKLREKGYKVGYARDIWAYHVFGDKNWGYDKDIKQERVLSEAPNDISFDQTTKEPSIRGNE